jgi:ABC-type sugar transport system ATPase subunit
LGKPLGLVPPLLDELDLDLDPREGLVLAGPSGAGKSRLLRVLAGLDRPSGGELTWSPDARAELVGAEGIHARWSVREHLESAVKRLDRRVRPSAAERDRRIAEAVELLDLSDRLKSLGGALSSGERSRLALACALVRRPGVWLMDEPWPELGAGARARFVDRLLELRRETGCAWIVATRDLAGSMSLADRVAVIEHGKITQTGVPRDVYRDPATREAGALLGMDFIEGRLDVRDGKRFFAFADGETEGVLPLSFVASVPDVPGAESGRGSIVLGVRPESVRFARTPEELGAVAIEQAAVPAEKEFPGWVALSDSEAGAQLGREDALELGLSGRVLRAVARVRGVEWMGRETRVSVQIGDQRWVLWAPAALGSAAATAGAAATGGAVASGSAVAPGGALKPGERIWVELDRAGIYWFDAQGARLRAPEISEQSEPLPTLALEEEPGTRGLKTGREKRDRERAPERGERPERGKEAESL